MNFTVSSAGKLVKRAFKIHIQYCSYLCNTPLFRRKTLEYPGKALLNSDFKLEKFGKK